MMTTLSELKNKKSNIKDYFRKIDSGKCMQCCDGTRSLHSQHKKASNHHANLP